MGVTVHQLHQPPTAAPLRPADCVSADSATSSECVSQEPNARLRSPVGTLRNRTEKPNYPVIAPFDGDDLLAAFEARTLCAATRIISRVSSRSGDDSSAYIRSNSAISCSASQRSALSFMASSLQFNLRASSSMRCRPVRPPPPADGMPDCHHMAMRWAFDAATVPPTGTGPPCDTATADPHRGSPRREACSLASSSTDG